MLKQSTPTILGAAVLLLGSTAPAFAASDGKADLDSVIPQGPVEPSSGAPLAWKKPIHDQQVPVVDAGSLHRSTTDPQEERGGWSSDELLVEIERPLDIVVGWRRKAGLHPRRQQGARNGWCGRIGPEWAAIMHDPRP